MESRKSIAARFYQLKTGHALLGKYLWRIGKRRDMECWWCGHEYQMRDHLLSGVKDGNKNRSGFGLMGKRGKGGMRRLRRC